MSDVIKNRLQELQALYQGVSLLNQALATTFGPRGSSALICKRHSLYFTKQGSSIAKELSAKDPYANVGLKLAREALLQTDQQVGEGTSTVMALTDALFAYGIEGVAVGFDPAEIKQGMQLAGNLLDQELGKLAVPMSHADPTKESIDVPIPKDKEIDYGYLSPYFVTHPETMTVRYEQAYILVCNQFLSHLNQAFIQFLDHFFSKQRSPIIVFAEEIDPQMLSLLIVNKIRGNLPICLVRVDGANKKTILEDIATHTGASLLGGFSDKSLSDNDLSVLGKVDSVVISQETTLLTQKHVVNRQAVSEEERAEYLEQQQREDYVPGGGSALARAAALIRLPQHLSVGVMFGCQCLLQAASVPLKIMARNCGKVPEAVLQEVLSHQDPHYGYNGETNMVENLVSSGVCDALKVVSQTVKNSVSVACLLLTSSFCIVDSHTVKPNPSQNPIA